MSTQGLYHYPAAISNSSLATAFATFRTTTGFSTNSIAGVINDFSDGRKQVGGTHQWTIPADLTDGVFPWLRN